MYVPFMKMRPAVATAKDVLFDDGAQVKTDGHAIVDLFTHLRHTYRRDVRFCDHHADEPVSMYCFDCHTVLCSRCTSSRTHRIHR